MRDDHVPPQQGQPALVTALQHISGLIRKELQLARLEVAENLAKARTGAILIVVAVILAFVALSSLIEALTMGLIAAGMEPWLAALLVGAGLLILALVLALSAARLLKSVSAIPTETMNTVKKDIKTLKESLDD